MNILMIEWKAYGQQDIRQAFLAEGHHVVLFPFPVREDARWNSPLEKNLEAALHKEVPDIVFSFNFFPVVSKVCNKEYIRYLSWVYDCPHVSLYSCAILNPCNTVYVFDKELYAEFYHAGISSIHYLPLAADTERLDAIDRDAALPFLYDVSFVGATYTEMNNFYDRMDELSEYTRGYLDALMSSQMKVYGYNFIQESLEPVIDDLYRALPYDPNPDGAETREYFYAQYVINRKITSMERTELFSAVAQHHTLDLFTFDRRFTMPNLNNHGSVEFYHQMPKVFKQSKINLNITLRSIKSGIPLRAFDIMGSGGFLLSNFQADFLDSFVPGEDFVYYESKEDLQQKIKYYLANEQERQEIAKNGHDKLTADHTYRHRVREMLSLVE